MNNQNLEIDGRFGEEFAGKAFGQQGEFSRIAGLQGQQGPAPKVQDIDLDIGAVKADRIALGQDSMLRWLVDQPAKLAEAPAQRSARVVRDFPKHLA